MLTISDNKKRYEEEKTTIRLRDLDRWKDRHKDVQTFWQSNDKLSWHLIEIWTIWCLIIYILWGKLTVRDGHSDGQADIQAEKVVYWEATLLKKNNKVCEK